MEPFLNKFVSLVKHLLENSHKVQIIQSVDRHQTSLFCSRLAQDMASSALVLNVDAESYLNNYQQDFFLDWAADQFEGLLKKNQDKFDSPWLIIITQAHFLEPKNLEQLFTLKHQRENARLHLLFQFPQDINIEKFLSTINDPIVTEQQYHIHSLPDPAVHQSYDFSQKKALICLGILSAIIVTLYFYQPSASVKKPLLEQTPAELFTDNSLGTWSDETEEKIEDFRDELESDLEKTSSTPEHEESATKKEAQSQYSEIEKVLSTQGDEIQLIEQQTGSNQLVAYPWSWQLIAFNTPERAEQFKKSHCNLSCTIAQNQIYYVVLLGQYLSYNDGLLDKEKALKITPNPWLRETSELVKR